MPEKAFTPLDDWVEMQKTMKTPGWELFKSRVSQLADELLKSILDRKTNKDEREYQIHAFNLLGGVMKIPMEIEETAKIHEEENKHA